MKNKDERRAILPHGPSLMEAWGKTESQLKLASAKGKPAAPVNPKTKGG